MTATDFSDNPSSFEPFLKWSDAWWGERPQLKRCVAHRRNGNQCKHPAMNGTTVCQTHGGRAPQVQMKAKIRIQEATDKAARELLGMMMDSTIPEGVRLSAIKDVLDRGGLSVRQGVDVEVSAKPFEKVFTSITSKPVVDAEVVGEEVEEEDPGSLKARLRMRNEVDEYSDLE